MARVLDKVCTAWVVANARVSKFKGWKGALQIAFDWFLKQTMLARILKKFPGKDLQMFTHTHPL